MKRKCFLQLYTPVTWLGGALFACILACSLMQCSDDQNSNSADPFGFEMTSSDCKSSFSAAKGAEQFDDCLEFTFSADNVLFLKHINAAFNCCPGQIIAEVQLLPDNVIVITENETETLCSCDCLYDLDYTIQGLTPGTYSISVVEPYTTADDPPLICQFTFVLGASDNCCVKRDHYPWTW